MPHLLSTLFYMLAGPPALAGGCLALILAAFTVLGAEPPPAADLRPAFEKWGLSPRAQGGRPTCSVFAFCGALEFASAKHDQPARLSVEFLNWSANQAAGQAADGGFFSDLWKGYQADGICLETNVPYRAQFDAAFAPTDESRTAAKKHLSLGLRLHWIKEWDVKTGLSGEQVAGIKRALDAGFPVCAGCRWPKHEKWDGAALQMCTPEAVFDGHSVLLVGYREDPAQAGGGVFLLFNSGSGLREGSMPYAYAEAYVNDALWID